jgi:hypothetical protein
MKITKCILCLDTDHYAGNFERETTAYATGVIGDCEVGDEQAAQFIAETDGVSKVILDEIWGKILHVSKDGCARPCDIQITPGWVNDGGGIHYRQSFDEPPTPEQLEVWRQNKREYFEPCLKSYRESLKKGIGGWTPETLEREEQRMRDIDNEDIHWYPAYYSVGIFFTEPLTEEATYFVVQRAKAYLTWKGVTLEQVRLITVFSEEKSEVLDVL